MKDKWRKVTHYKVILLASVYCTYLWLPIRNRLVKKLSNSFKYKNHDEQQLCDKVDAEIFGSNRVRLAVKFYYFLSTTFHCLNLAVNVLLIHQTEMKWFGTNTFTCYLPRLYIHWSLDPQNMPWLSQMISILHLIWRYVTLFYERQFDLNLITYLLWDEKTLNNASNLNNSAQTIELALLQSIIFLKYEDPNQRRLIAVRKPNRTVESRNKLIEQINSYTVKIIVLFTTAFMFFVPAGAIKIFFDQQSHYPDCIVANSSSFTFWIRVIPTACMSAIHFFDSFIALLLPISLGLILIEDQMIYWDAISARLEGLKQVLSARSSIETNKNFSAHRIRPTLLIDKRNQSLSMNHSINYLSLDDQAVQMEILQVQKLTGDFFLQMRCLDKLVSALLTFIIFVWLSYNGLLCAVGVQLSFAKNVSLIRVLQLLGIATIYTICHKSLRMKERTEPAFKTINYLAVVDPSRYKVDWIPLLNCFTERPCHGFTILHSKLFTRLTLFQICAYTFSIMIAAETIRHRSGYNLLEASDQ